MPKAEKAKTVVAGVIRDGVIEGAMSASAKTCSACGVYCTCITISEIQLPEGIKASTKLIVYEGDPSPPGYRPIELLGLGCGCYAKLHRQLAHIQDRMKK